MKMYKLLIRSKNTEVDTVLKQLIAAYISADISSDVYLSKIFDELKPISEQLTAAINQSKAESLLEDKDGIRDDVTRSIAYLVQGFMLHPDAAIKAAAAAVMTVFDKYGLEIIHESYAIESSLIDSMLKEFAEEDMVAEIAKIPGLADLISALTAAEADFAKTRQEYDQQKAEDSQRQSASEIKKSILEKVNGTLIVYLQAMHAVDEPTYGAFVRTTAEIINANNGAVKKRQAN